jgi:hypothetical protein
MPVATVNEDGHAAAGEDHIWAHPAAGHGDAQPLSEPQTEAMQLSAKA